MSPTFIHFLKIGISVPNTALMNYDNEYVIFIKLLFWFSWREYFTRIINFNLENI